MRQEKKYTFMESSLDDIRDSIKSSNLLMTNSYKNRFVNSLYLDSFNFENFNENMSGESKRSKPRLRWYSARSFEKITEKTELFLEIKLRSNIYGIKLTNKIPLPSEFQKYDADSLLDHIRKSVPIEFLPHIDHCSSFSLGVSYEREYFEDFTNQFRATIDRNISYLRPNDQEIFDVEHTELYKMEYCILELKFAQRNKDDILPINFNCVEVTPGRHSKYTVGLYTIYR